MPQRLSVEEMLTLAPDAASVPAARRLAVPGPWSDTGTAGPLVWGLCAGSGKTPYQAVVDLDGPAFTCSCPSRKFPCKHALALLVLWAGGAVADADQPADHAAAWKAARAERSAAAAAAERSAAAAAPREPKGERDEQAAANRARLRADRVTAGLAELDQWLRDQVVGGLSGITDGYRHAEQIAARMIDAQAPGIAGRLRATGGVPASGEGWPARLLGAYGQLHLLTRAHQQLDELPPDLAASVRTHVGYPTSREQVLTRPPVTDDWAVLGVRDIPDGAVPARRVWLRGRQSARWALLLAFDPSGRFGDSPDANLALGAVVTGDLHFYPGRGGLRALRAVTGDPDPVEPSGAVPEPDGSFDRIRAAWAARLEADPWCAEMPAVLFGAPELSGSTWSLADPSGQAVPLQTAGIEPWLLMAVSGGAPVTVAGEWSATAFRPLTVWDADRSVRL